MKELTKYLSRYRIALAIGAKAATSSYRYRLLLEVTLHAH